MFYGEINEIAISTAGTEWVARAQDETLLLLCQQYILQRQHRFELHCISDLEWKIEDTQYFNSGILF